MWMAVRRITRCVDCLCTALLLFGVTEGSAQVPAAIPTPAEPHRQTLPVEPSVPEPSPEIETRPGTQLMPQRAHEIKIAPFRGIRLAGGTVYPEHELEHYYHDLINTEITLARVYQIAREIQQRYRSDGYLLTRVVLPRQTVTDNVFKLQIVEGYIGAVRVEGVTGSIADHIDSLLAKVTEHRPVNRRELERYLLLINDLPGIEARGVLRPTAGELGASELVLRVDHRRLEGFMVLNNRGSQYTGPWRGMLVNRSNSMLGLGERFELMLMATPDEEQQYASLSYRQPIGTEGAVFDLLMSYGPSQPGYTLKPLEMESKVAHLGVSIMYPRLRSRTQNLYAVIGFDAVNSDVDMWKDEPYSRDRLRVLHAGGSYDFIDRRGAQTNIGVSIRQGLSGFGAGSNDDELRSRTEGKNDFTSIQFQGSTSLPVFDIERLLIAAKGQYAFDTLLSDEEFRLGGEQFGRGYDPSELAGEHGIGLSVEIQRNAQTSHAAYSEYQLYGFYDAGVVWNEDTGSVPRESLASAGVGVRARTYDNFILGLELARPMTREVSAKGDKDPRIYLQISAHF